MTLNAFESPWMGALLFLAAATLTYLLARQSGKPQHFAMTIVLLVAAALPFFLDWWVVTPTEQVDAMLDKLAAAAVQGDVTTIVNAIAPVYDDGVRDHDRMVALVRSEMDGLKLEGVAVRGRQFETDGLTVVAKFVATISAAQSPRGSTASYPVRLRLTFVNSGDAWLIMRVQRFAIVGPKASTEIPLDSL